MLEFEIRDMLSVPRLHRYILLLFTLLVLQAVGVSQNNNRPASDC